MNEAQLRARIRGLISVGDLPLDPPRPGTGSVSAAPPVDASISSGTAADGAVCLICGQAGPQTTYEDPNGRRTQVHLAPCDTAWREEAARLRRGHAPHDNALPKDAFIRWLDGRLAQDADFENRMQAALRELRIERIAAAIHAARSRTSPAGDSASPDRSITC